MNDIVKLGLYMLLIAAVVFGAYVCVSEMVETLQEMTQPETIELTIEHLWEENGKYYFADANGNIYKLGNYVDINEKILYNDMPKQRFEMLNKGCVYNCMYISGTNNWISISEMEVKKNDRRNK